MSTRHPPPDIHILAHVGLWGVHGRHMVFALGHEDLHEQGIPVALVPYEGGPSGDALADVHIDARAHVSRAYVNVASLSLKGWLLLPSP